MSGDVVRDKGHDVTSIEQFAATAASIDPVVYEPCDAACGRVHGASGRHRVPRQDGTRGSKLRRVAGVASALALRTHTLPGGAELRDLEQWAREHLDDADAMAASLARDLVVAVGELAP